jgi:hypothetical protein
MSKKKQLEIAEKMLIQIILSDKKKQAELSRRININLHKLKVLRTENLPKLKISNHFLIRYCERVEPLTYSELLNKLTILYKDVIINNLGVCNIQHNGTLLVIRDYTFITIHKIYKNGT